MRSSTQAGLYSRLYAQVKQYRGRIVLAVVGMLGTALTEPMFPAVMKPLLDNGFTGKPSFRLWVVPVAIIGIFLLRGMCTFTTNYMLSWVSNKMLNDLRAKMFRRILDVPISFYHSES